MIIFSLERERVKRDILLVVRVHFKVGCLFTDTELAVNHLLSEELENSIAYEVVENLPFVKSLWQQYEYANSSAAVQPFPLESWIVHRAVAGFISMLCCTPKDSDSLTAMQWEAARRCLTFCVRANQRSVEAGGGSYITSTAAQ